MATPLYQHGRLGKSIVGGEKFQLANRVQLFDFDHGNPVSQQWLEPGTLVTIDADETRKALRKGFKFVYVTAANGRQGFIPKWIVNDFLYAASKDNRDALTGVSYGGDKWMMDAARNLFAFPIDDSNKQRCVKCGASANEHKLMETKEAKTLCADFAASLGDDLLRGLGRGHLGDTGVMIGVLETANAWIFAHSGMGTHDLFAGKVAKFGRERNLGVVHAAPSLQAADPFYVDDRGGTMPFATVRNFAQFGPAATIDTLVCAAPKLIQKAYSLNQKPITLSESWIGHAHEKFKDLDTIKSCDRCRKTVSYMVCPT